MSRNYLREAFESTPGNESNTPTLSTFKHFARAQSAQVEPNVSQITRDDELGGDNQPQAILVDQVNPNWSKKGRAYPQQLVKDLTHFFGDAVIRTGNGVITDIDSVVIPAGAYEYKWTAPFGPTGTTPKTTQMDVGYVEEAKFYKAKGCAAQDFALNTPQEGASECEISGPALYLARQSDPSLTATPESVAIQPFKFRDLDLPADLASAGAAIGFNFKANNPMQQVRSLSAASYFPDLMEYADEGLLVCEAEIERRHLSTADWDALIAATGFALTARWTSQSIIASSYPYKLWIQFSNAQYTGNDMDELNNSRRAGDKFTVKATTGGSASCTITLVCATASVA